MHDTLCALLIAATAVAAQSSNPSDWVGVWQGELDGQPSIVLTLATDDGTLQGTLVLNGINKEDGKPHIVVRETHVLLHTKINAQSLLFEVRGIRGSGKIMNFEVDQTSHDHAKIHCLNCGDDAPVVEMARQG